MAVKVIKAAAGLGKTSRLVSLLDNTLYGKVEVYVPTHELGEQISASLEVAFQHRVVIKGRSQPSPRGGRMCAKHKQAELLSEKGYPVYPVLCAKRDDRGHVESCEHYENCQYIAQFTGPERIFIYTHASLPLERGPLEDELPQLAVIDESFFRSCIEIFTVPLADMLSQPPGSASEKVCAALVDMLKSGKQVLYTIKTEDLETPLQAAIDEHKPTLPHFSPYWSERKQKRTLAHLAPRPRIRELLETLQGELATGRHDSHAVMFEERTKTVRVHRRRPITRFSGGKHGCDVLILDADADLLLVRRWFPDATLESIPAERKAHVVQCTTTRCSTTSLVPDRNADPTYKAAAQRRLEDLQLLINRKAADGRRVLVVGPQAITGNANSNVPALVSVPPGSELAHFGAIRGVDRWKGFDAAIIVGRNQPPLTAVEALARAIWFDDPQPLVFSEDWTLEKRGYRLRGAPAPLGIEVQVHPDRRVQAVLEQLRESESTQAVDRLRLIHAQKAKEIVLLSNIPLDIDVDELRSWDDIIHGSRLQQAWSRVDGVLPLAPNWLSKHFSDLWPTEDAAEVDVRRMEKNADFANRLLLAKPKLLAVHYRVRGQKRHSRAISVLSLGQTQSKLSDLLGGLPVIVREVNDGMHGPEHFGAVGDITLPPLDGSGQG